MQELLEDLELTVHRVHRVFLVILACQVFLVQPEVVDLLVQLALLEFRVQLGTPVPLVERVILDQLVRPDPLDPRV